MIALIEWQCPAILSDKFVNGKGSPLTECQSAGAYIVISVGASWLHPQAGLAASLRSTGRGRIADAISEGRKYHLDLLAIPLTVASALRLYHFVIRAFAVTRFLFGLKPVADR